MKSENCKFVVFGILLFSILGMTPFVYGGGCLEDPSSGPLFTCSVTGDDLDGDGITDVVDNCPFDFNPDQTDTDGDGVGDACDVCEGDDNIGDSDGDFVCDDLDVCLGDDFTGDSDGDFVCDDLDVCLGDDIFGDSDGDFVCDDLDVCLGDDFTGDSDGDFVCDDNDNCPTTPNPDQTDTDGNGAGDVCQIEQFDIETDSNPNGVIEPLNLPIINPFDTVTIYGVDGVFGNFTAIAKLFDIDGTTELDTPTCANSTNNAVPWIAGSTYPLTLTCKTTGLTLTTAGTYFWDVQVTELSGNYDPAVQEHDGEQDPLEQFVIPEPQQEPGTLKVKKLTDGEDDKFNFLSDVPLLGNFDITTVGGMGMTQQVNASGIFSIDEIVPEGWQLVSSGCDNGDEVDAIEISTGDHVTCTFENEKDVNSFTANTLSSAVGIKQPPVSNPSDFVMINGVDGLWGNFTATAELVGPSGAVGSPTCTGTDGTTYPQTLTCTLTANISELGDYCWNVTITELSSNYDSAAVTLTGSDDAADECFELKNLLGEVDIKPKSDPNSINIKSMGVIPVAILGTSTLNVTDIDVTTLMFENASPTHELTKALGKHITNVNNDNWDDLISHYSQKQTGIQCGDTEATITWELLNGTPMEGTDSINPVPCKSNNSINPPQIQTPGSLLTSDILTDDKGSGGDEHLTRPTFGISHETQETIVDGGFRFNDQIFAIDDNHHTLFAQQSINIGEVNSFEVKIYADKKLKVQEFLFGIPNVGEAHFAELGIEVWYNLNGEIEQVKAIQKSNVIDKETLVATHEKTRCQSADIEKKCDSTIVSMVFLEPLKDDVMAVKAIDYKNRYQITYLNEGIEIAGESLNPMLTSKIPSSLRDEGLILVTQTEKYSDYWIAEDGRLFEMNQFGSFKQVNQTFERLGLTILLQFLFLH